MSRWHKNRDRPVVLVVGAVDLQIAVTLKEMRQLTADLKALARQLDEKEPNA